MKVLFFTTFTKWVPAFETDLELMQLHLDRGDQILHLYCDGSLPACDANFDHNFNECLSCISKREHGSSLLLQTKQTIYSRPFLNLTDSDRRILGKLKTHFQDLEELKNYRIDDLDIGDMALASLISATRDPEPDLDRHREFLRRLLMAVYSVFRSVQRHLDQSQINLVYVNNGRLGPARAALRAAQSRGVRCIIHERGHKTGFYSLWENTTPHDLEFFKKEIPRRWHEAAADPDRDKIACNFFDERKEHRHPWWDEHFTKMQEKGLLPKSWDGIKRNVAVFLSSEDEWAALTDWTNPLYKNQLAALEAIADSLSAMRNQQNLELYARVHPHVAGVRNPYLKRLIGLKKEFLTIIPPDDSVSTYALVEHADRILTFGSTVGIESVYWRKPSILAGQAFYRDLGGTYNPKTHEELIDLLLIERLAPKDRIAALMYGYYMNTFGTPFRFVTFPCDSQAAFRGEIITNAIEYRVRSRLVPKFAQRAVGRAIQQLSFKRPINNLFREVTKRKMMRNWL